MSRIMEIFECIELSPVTKFYPLSDVWRIHKVGPVSSLAIQSNIFDLGMKFIRKSMHTKYVYI